VFQFKQFAVSDDNCAMKVGTDAVLLGAWSGIPYSNSISRILDVGSGCGILALMMAQQTNAFIDAVEIDEDSCKTATINFTGSAWSDRLNCIHSSFQDFVKISEYRYDIILSNPPFFSESLLNPKEQRAIARHQVLLGFDALFDGVSQMLHPDGIFNLIYPLLSNESIDIEAGRNGLFCSRKTFVYPKPGKPCNRVLASFGRKDVGLVQDDLLIRNGDAVFSEQYRQLTREFYLNF
jgi:tRNA1Val (adenine37-N6)-methyltransferase